MVFSLEFEDVFALLKFVNADDSVCWTSFDVGLCLHCLSVSVLVMVVIMVSMIVMACVVIMIVAMVIMVVIMIVTMVIMIVAVVIMIIVSIFVTVVVVLGVRETVCNRFSVKF